MVARSHAQLSSKTPCPLLSISRSGWYNDPNGKLRRLIDEPVLATPYYGRRQMARW